MARVAHARVTLALAYRIRSVRLSTSGVHFVVTITDRADMAAKAPAENEVIASAKKRK